MIQNDLARAGVVAIFGMLVSLAPLATGIAFALRPTERRLTLMRPLSLAALFAGLNTLLSGIAAVLRGVATAHGVAGYGVERFGFGLSESLTPLFVAFGFLAVAWLCVAIGLRRQP
jgi:hypothetical protein